MSSRWAARILVLSLAILFALAASEIVLRVAWHNPYRHESPDHLLKLRVHHPRTDHVYSRPLIDALDSQLRLRTDDRSYILPSIRYQEADATVVFFGGSTTECLAVREELRFPTHVSDLLAKEGLEVNSLNVARAGNSVHDAINVLLNHVVVDEPEIAVLMEASNDIGMLRLAGSYGPSMGQPVSVKHLGKWLVQIASSRLYLLGLMRQAAIPNRVRTENPATDWRQSAPPTDSVTVRMYRQRLRAFVHICRDFDIVPVLMTQPYSRHRTSATPAWLDETAQDQFNEVIREVGRSEGVLVIDLVEHLRDEIPNWDKPNEIFYDAIHVTDHGSQVYARHIAAQLQPVILGLE